MKHPKLQLFQHSPGEFSFQLTDRNGETLLKSSEDYTSKLFCLSAMEFIKAHAPYDNCFRRKITADGQYYFSLRASSGQTLGISKLYDDYFGRENGISSVKSNAPFAGIEDLTATFCEGVLEAP